MVSSDWPALGANQHAFACKPLVDLLMYATLCDGHGCPLKPNNNVMGLFNEGGEYPLYHMCVWKQYPLDTWRMSFDVRLSLQVFRKVDRWVWYRARYARSINARLYLWSSTHRQDTNYGTAVHNRHQLRRSCQQQTPNTIVVGQRKPDHISAGSSGTTASSACSTGSIAADIAGLDSVKAVTAMTFSTTDGCTAARVDTSTTDVDNASLSGTRHGLLPTVVHIVGKYHCRLLQRVLRVPRYRYQTANAR